MCLPRVAEGQEGSSRSLGQGCAQPLGMLRPAGAEVGIGAGDVATSVFTTAFGR